MLGQQIGSYTILSELGAGGMGVVYLAEHSVMKRKAVVKVLRPELTADPEISQRFINEATAAASIRHPGIVDVMDVGQHPTGFLYILMEFLEGDSLATRLRRERTLSVDKTILFTRQILGALAGAHQRKIVHRDLKPDNLFIIRDPEVAGGERTKILDFGIAKLATERGNTLTRAGAMMGTPIYMSPEQCRGAGEVDHRSDLYSIGCIVFEMLVGRPPFLGEGVGDLISSHMKEPAPRLRSFNAALPAELDAILSRLLEKLPDARFSSCEELAIQLDSVVRSSSSIPPSARPAVPDVPPTVPPTVAPTIAPPRPLGIDVVAPTIALPPPLQPVLTTHSHAIGEVVSGPPAKKARWLPIAAGVGMLGIGATVVAIATTRHGTPTVDAHQEIASIDAAAPIDNQVEAKPALPDPAGYGVLLLPGAATFVELGKTTAGALVYRNGPRGAWTTATRGNTRGSVVRLRPSAFLEIVKNHGSTEPLGAYFVDNEAVLVEVGPPLCDNKLSGSGNCSAGQRFSGFGTRTEPAAAWTPRALSGPQQQFSTGAFILVTGDGLPAAPAVPTSTTVSEVAPPVRSETILFEVRVTSQPSNASISVNGTPSGTTTPAKLKLPPNVQATITLSKNGFISETLKVTPQKDGSAVNQVLRKDPRATPSATGEPTFDDLLAEAKRNPDDKPKPTRMQLSSADFKNGMNAVTSAAQACFKGTQGTANVKLSIAPSGRVTKATVSGAFAGKPEGVCVETAVQGAVFPAWNGGPQSFNYSYLLSE